MNCNECKMNGAIRLIVCDDCEEGKNFYEIFTRSFGI